MKKINTTNKIEEKLSEDAADHIMNEILDQIRKGVLVPGDRLPSENRLSSSYKTNVYSVRKALAKLKEGGYLYTIPKFGVYVGNNHVPPSEEFRKLAEYGKSARIDLRFSTRSHLGQHRELWQKTGAEFKKISPFSEVTVHYQEDGCSDLLSGDILEYSTISKHYIKQPDLLNLQHYFPRDIRYVEQMPDPRGVPFYYAVPVLLYNEDLLDRLGIAPPAYRNYQEQLEYFEMVTAKTQTRTDMKLPGSSQTVLSRLGHYVREIFECMLDPDYTLSEFRKDYREILIAVTQYWKKYQISYPQSAETNVYDFLSGRSPLFFGMNADYMRFKEFDADFRYGGAMMYAVDDSFCRILVALTVHKQTENPVECVRLLRELQKDHVQKTLNSFGCYPLQEENCKYLPYQMVIPAEKAGAPLYFRTPEEYNVCMNILNAELWNVILCNKKIDHAVEDILYFSRACLRMSLDQMTSEQQEEWKRIYNIKS